MNTPISNVIKSLILCYDCMKKLEFVQSHFLLRKVIFLKKIIIIQNSYFERCKNDKVSNSKGLV